MRYRSYGRSETAVSALTVELKDAPGRSRAADWRGVVFNAMENGINAFELGIDASLGLMAGAGEALAAIERRLSFVTVRCRVGAGDLEGGSVLRRASETAERLGLDRLDCLMLEGDYLEAMTTTEIERLVDLREIAVHVGVTGSERLDALAMREIVDAVAVPYSLASPVRDRNRIRNLSAAGAAVVAYEACPAAVIAPPAEGVKRGLFGRPIESKPSGGYNFLHETWGWTAEQICIGYVLTEPGVTSIRIGAGEPRQMALLAEVVDRDVPGGLGAQVEMARFAVADAPENTLRRA
jgi:aryl-alcohol dehydrogenase-like predicted oxidoreductase